MARTGKHTLLIAVMVLALGTLLAGSSSVKAQQETEEPSFQAPEKAEFEPGEIIVKLEEDASQQDLAALNRRNGVRIEEDLPLPDTSVVDLPVQAAAQRYEASPAVEYAEPNFLLFSARAPNDTHYPKLYGLNNTGQTGGTEGADIDAPAAWEITQGNPDTLVAVIDTGVDINHSDLKGNIWVNEGEVPNNGKDDDGNGYVDDVNGWDFWNENNTVYDAGDGDEHGTHVAGTIAAEGNNSAGVIGVNWRASIMPLKFLGPQGRLHFGCGQGHRLCGKERGQDQQQLLGRWRQVIGPPGRHCPGGRRRASVRRGGRQRR